MARPYRSAPLLGNLVADQGLISAQLDTGRRCPTLLVKLDR